MTLSKEWRIRSGADLLAASASGICPCDEPQPFAGVGEISLNDRRFGTTLRIECPPIGAGDTQGAHTLSLKVAPSPAWLRALRLP